MTERGDQQKRSTSILNDVIGPVMRGPSSSHTAGSLRIGKLARALMGDELAKVTFAFDPDGSLAQVYRQQGSDLAFAAGVVGLSLTDERFDQALDIAAEQGLEVTFVVEPLPGADHPNTVRVRLASRNGVELCVTAASIGGGAVVLTRLAGWPVYLTGDAFEVLVVSEVGVENQVQEIVARDGKALGSPTFVARDDQVLVHVRRQSPLSGHSQAEIEALPGVLSVWTAPPVLFVQRGAPLFASAADMVRLAEERNCSLGQIMLAYEATLLGVPESEVLAEVVHRFEVMRASVHRGLEAALPPMRLLQPSAHQIYQAEAQGRVAVGGIHTRAAARALAVMHVNGGMGVVCAAPTGGSAGVVPGTLVTLVEERDLGPKQAALALLAASAVGLIVAERATFAAEVAGCQVEIGVAGAMAAAAVVETVGGSVQQAADAAAIALQNTVGLICDMVQGVVEIPCHTRNGVAASSAFVCADLILGGYVNPIPLDETIDAVYAVGRMLPRELKCTALGGLALAPSALALGRQG